jgi:hypothetical protein
MNPAGAKTTGRSFAPPSARREKIAPWHQELLYLMVTEPLLNQKQLAERLGRHVITVGQVQRSDIFRAKLDQMRAEHEAEVTKRVMQKMDQCIERGLAHVSNHLDGEEVDPRFALDAVVKLDSRRRGDKSVNLHAHQHQIDPEVWDRAREAVRSHASNEDLVAYVSSSEESDEGGALSAPELD